MSCLEMTAVGPDLQTPDPTKHVLYNLGMVLGVDDFTQEFAYLSGRDQWLAREALGYGTLDGLRVSQGTDAKGPYVKVCPGTALTPRGQLVRVAPAQCAYLDPWLAANGQTLLDLGIAPPTGELRLWVVLCYRDCPTDTVQIPGEPCRSETNTRVPSRLQDDFSLEIRTVAPDQTEEDAIRRFVDWLRHIHPSPDPVGTLSRDQFADLVRQEGPLLLSPIQSPIGSPGDEIAIPAEEVCDYLRIAFRIWVTELRPKYHREPPPGGTGCEPPRDVRQGFEDCLMLAELTVPVQQAGSQWEVPPGTEIAIDEGRRPVLVSLRMMQEWLECGRCCGDTEKPLAGDVTGPETGTFVSSLQGIDLAATHPAEGQLLGIQAGVWQPVTPASLGGDVVGSPDIAQNRIDRLQTVAVDAAGANDKDVLTCVGTGTARQWKPVPPAVPPPVLLHDDVISTATGSSTIAKMQNITVAAASANDKDVLTCVGTGAARQWKPVPPAAVAPAVLLKDDVISTATGSATIAKLQTVPVDAAAANDKDVLTCVGTGAARQWKPVPPAAVAPAVLLKDDVISTATGSATIAALQGNVVSAQAPNNQDVLTFLQPTAGGKGKWVPQKPSTGSPPAGPQIVAGGAFFLFDQTAGVNSQDSFGGLDVLGMNRLTASQLYIFVGFDAFDPKRFYVVSGSHWCFNRQISAFLELIRIDGDDSAAKILEKMLNKDGKSVTFTTKDKGILLRLTYLTAKPDASMFGLTVQVTQW